jgi:eukaryotic-like serine/threonine-protein kinase
LHRLRVPMNWNDALENVLIDNRYRVQKRLGSGGMGTVYEAVDVVLDRSVAVKVGHDGASSTEIERFLREARIMAALDHPHIVRVLNLGQIGRGRPYMIMELLRGRTFSRIAEDGAVKLSRIIDRLWEIAAALDWIHSHGIVHRDLKLDNLMLIRRIDGTEATKLFDFGIAFDRAQAKRRLTHDGSIVGTPLYLAPEMIEADEVGPQADIYSFGVVIYQLLTGAAPFESLSPLEILRRKINADAPLMSKFRHDLPPGVAEIVGRSLARYPSDRHPSATALVRELSQALEAQRARTRRREKRYALAGSVAFSLAALISGCASIVSFADYWVRK